MLPSFIQIKKNILKYKLTWLVLIYLAALIGMRLLWYTEYSPPSQPHAVQGELDLSSWQFDDRQTITLNGQWNFHPDIFLSPRISFSDRLSIANPTKVPGTFNDTSPEANFGSYRLRVTLPKSNTSYGIHIPEIKTAYRLYINGNLLYESGHPDETSIGTISKVVPYTGNFTVEQSNIDIVIHVSNFHYHNKGGIIQSIKFGTSAAVMKEKYNSENMQLLVGIILLLHMLYVVILLFVGHRKKELFYFAGIIIFALIVTWMDDDRMLLQWLPINFEWAIRMRIIGYSALSYCLVLCTKHLLSVNSFKKLIIIFSIFFYSYAAINLFFPLAWLDYTSKIIAIFMLSAILLVPIISRQAVRTGQEAAISILLAGIAVSINMVFSGFFKSRFDNDLPFYPIDLIVAFVVFASFWFVRFTKTAIRAEKQAAELKKVDKQKDEFLANTSHELRNPLHAIINIAQSIIIRRNSRMDTMDQEDLMLITKVGQRMSHLLDDLIDITLLKDSRITLNIASVSLSAVSRGIIQMLNYMTVNKNVQLVNEIPDSLPNVAADENRLIQIIFNLVHNALKYTSEGSVSLRAEVLNKTVYIHIADTGIGINEEMKHRIFSPYEQSDSSITSQGSGLGLGLSICKNLVELHGGTLELKSVLGKGSIFTFNLPLAATTTTTTTSIEGLNKGHVIEDHPVQIQHTMKGNSEVAVSSENGYKMESVTGSILIVDDDAINLKVIKSLLDLSSYDVTTVNSAEKALKQISLNQWDLVVVDVMMPEMSGYELTELIRKKFTIFELPVLLLTARIRPEDIHTGFLAGANDYLAKPVEVLELQSRVRALIHFKQSVDEQLRMEAAWLQAQIQPHFLFNTINSIASLSLLDPDRMIALLVTFGDYLKGSFNSRNLERLVPLSHELDLLRAYLYIEKERFGERLEVEWNLPDHLEAKLPPLTIQPIVENAIRHGILNRASGGKLTITAKKEENCIKFIIHDNGVGMDETKLSSLLDGKKKAGTSGVGIINTDRRLKKIYGQGLAIQSTPGGGTTVSFIVPNSAHMKN
ncbi:two-component system sensor histidine kinase ChiS [Paenibacillus sp. W4I10]|uniref:ATP-binding protein n=1 Tax=Paenibacillus sp. W4I10 TaxID=3042298 RepID=UPI0027803E51|nr:ATP-binding protein [Paenibacillus sp. W4I10]MDQ0724922.1 two-component system sensor histidine kinase ChiS [Paenibacillus sp. W4I10]